MQPCCRVSKTHATPKDSGGMLEGASQPGPAAPLEDPPEVAEPHLLAAAIDALANEVRRLAVNINAGEVDGLDAAAPPDLSASHGPLSTSLTAAARFLSASRSGPDRYGDGARRSWRRGFGRRAQPGGVECPTAIGISQSRLTKKRPSERPAKVSERP